MQPFRRKLLLTLFKLSDSCILSVSLLLAHWIATKDGTWVGLEEWISLRIRLVNVVGFFALIVAWHVLFDQLGLYRSRRLRPGSPEWTTILKATTVGTAVVALAGVLFDFGPINASYFISFWTVTSALTIAFRATLRLLLRRLRLFGINLRNIVIVGTNERAYEFAAMIGEAKELGYRLLGFIDERVHLPHQDVELLGGFQDFQAIVRAQIVDDVFIALPIKSFYDQIGHIVRVAEERGITTRYLSDLFEHAGRTQVEVYDRFSILTIATGPQEGWEYLAKYCLDKALALTLLLLTAPVMLLVPVLIKLTSPGPVLFVQERVGLNRRVFKLYKFRTMVETAPRQQREVEALNEMDGPVFKVRNDPRVTKVGRWLRTWSIDELPQLFNVLAGDMSLVGPRPLPVRDFARFADDWHRRRFSVRPGITCTWQVGGRNRIGFEEWMKLDMEYIDNWKFTKDLEILVKTIPAVLRGSGV